MSMISDPESWLGLRPARALDGETPPPATPATPRTPAGAGLGGLFRRMLRIFRRR